MVVVLTMTILYSCIGMSCKYCVDVMLSIRLDTSIVLLVVTVE